MLAGEVVANVTLFAQFGLGEIDAPQSGIHTAVSLLVLFGMTLFSVLA